MAFDAFRSLIAYNNPSAEWENIDDIMSDIWNRTASAYNVTLAADEIVAQLPSLIGVDCEIFASVFVSAQRLFSISLRARYVNVRGNCNTHCRTLKILSLDTR